MGSEGEEERGRGREGEREQFATAGRELDLDGGGTLQTELLWCSETLCHVLQEAKPESLRWRSLETLASSGARSGGRFLAGSSRKIKKSNIVLLVISRVFINVPSRLLCSRSVTLLGGGNNRRISPSSRTSGMGFYHKGLTVGVESLFLNSSSNKPPDPRSATAQKFCLETSRARPCRLAGIQAGFCCMCTQESNLSSSVTPVKFCCSRES